MVQLSELMCDFFFTHWAAILKWHPILGIAVTVNDLCEQGDEVVAPKIPECSKFGQKQFLYGIESGFP